MAPTLTRLGAGALVALILAAAAAPRAVAMGTGTGAASPYAVVDARNSGLEFENLPGFTRSVYERDHAVIAPESRAGAYTRSHFRST
jgi:hypothetical protein